MKLGNVEFPTYLLKFYDKKEHRDDFINGDIYLKESGYFRKLEDVYRGDKNDGRRPMNPQGLGLSFEVPNVMTIPINDVYEFQEGFDGDDKIPIFCASFVNEKIVYKTGKESYRFKKEFIDELSKFGMYAVFIDLHELREKLKKISIKNEISYKENFVTYSNILKKYTEACSSPKTLEEQYQSFFYKDSSYRWQNEWRLVLDTTKAPLIYGDADNYILHLGKFKSAMSLNVDQFANKEICIEKDEETCTIAFI